MCYLQIAEDDIYSFVRVLSLVWRKCSMFQEDEVGFQVDVIAVV